VEKLIVRTAAKTVVIILIIVAIIFAVFNFVFPQHMATYCENVGNYSLAVKYTSLRYTYTGSADDLERCVQDSILSGVDDYIADYGKQLLDNDELEQIVERNGDGYPGGQNYYEYLSGKVAASKSTIGDFDGAWEIALKANGTTSFKSGNPVTTLAIRIISDKNKDAATKMVEKLQEITPQEESEQTSLRELTKRLRSVALS
jgi:hypothetical protein